MNNVKETASYGSQKVVWENVVDILAGGVHVSNATTTLFPDSVIPAGTLVSEKQSDGTHKVVTVTAGNPATFDFEPLGMTHFDIALDDMPYPAIVLSGTFRKEAAPENVSENWADISPKIPRITGV